MNKRETHEKLKNSLDMVSLRMYLFMAGIVGLTEGVVVLLGPRTYGSPSKWIIFLIMAAISVLPILIFCACRTISIFRCPESYHICKAKLCNPKGGRIRDTIRFLVFLEDRNGWPITAYTHSIFQTHKSMFGLALEEYINQEVTIGYNEETGQVVVMG